MRRTTIQVHGDHTLRQTGIVLCVTDGDHNETDTILTGIGCNFDENKLIVYITVRRLRVQLGTIAFPEENIFSRAYRSLPPATVVAGR